VQEHYVKYKRTAEKKKKVCWPKTEHSKDGRKQPKKNNLKKNGEWSREEERKLWKTFTFQNGLIQMTND